MPGDKSFIQQYVYEIVPKVNTQAWSKASGTIKGYIAKSADGLQAYKNASSVIEKYSGRKDLDKGQMAELASAQELVAGMDKNSIALSKVASTAGRVIDSGSLLYDLINVAINTAEQLIETGKDISNKFVGAGSMFVDSSTKSTMATLGVNAESAQELNLALKKLGISLDDVATLTSGQRYALQDLYDTYKEGIDSIDNDKLEAFNENMQKYELMKAEFEIKFQTTLIKLFAESEELPKLLDAMNEGLDVFIDLLSSDLLRQGFEAVVSFVTTIVDLATLLGKGLSFLTGNSSVSSKSVAQTNNTSNYFYGNSSASAIDNTISYQQGRELESLIGSI